MFQNFKEWFLKFITSRFVVLYILCIIVAIVIISRLFELQIVNGESYQNDFTLKIRKERSIESTRGNIYDVNGNVLAYNELAYSVMIEDVYPSGSDKNNRLNKCLNTLIDMIEGHGDKIIEDFNIVLDEDGNFSYTVSGTNLLRFLADIYGYSTVGELTYAEKTSSPDDVINYLAGRSRFGIGAFATDEEGKEIRDEKGNRIFNVGEGYTVKRLLQLVTIRYAMSLNSYQKYIPTVIASQVCDETIAAVMENTDILDGVSISETTVRKYVDSIYFSNIIGYTGKISTDEMLAFAEEGLDYNRNDIIGKSGVEQTMEQSLQGIKGNQVVFVDNTGKVVNIESETAPVSGNDVYLSVDKDLQEAVYHILEQKIAGIVVSKIRNVKEYVPQEGASASKIIIPIYDVYYALFDNNVLKMKDFNHLNATQTENTVYANYLDYKDDVISRLGEELKTKGTIYTKLKNEYQIYESYIVSMLMSDNVGILDGSLIDTQDATYQAWRNDETISLKEYLTYCISQNWINTSKLTLEGNYAGTDEIYAALVDYILQYLDKSSDFGKKITKYMILSDKLTGKQICQLLIDTGTVILTNDEVDRFQKGRITAYQFMIDRITNLDITPAQLALDPSTGDIVVTDVNTGSVLAMVSYPGYDANKVSDSAYWTQINVDKTYPMLNKATQRRTAPGSSFKMITAAATLEEGILNSNGTITCTGTFTRLNSNNHCWVYPGSHGNQNVVSAIKNSCNCYFYEIGYRLSLDGGNYNENQGIEALSKYADLFGLSDTSGVEVSEYMPKVSDEYPVVSAIGQGSANYTTSQLARYVTTVANSGTCYDLTLIDKICLSDGTLLKKNSANVRNVLDFAPSTWKSIHNGMKQVVESKYYYRSLDVSVAGKTGTAQESKTRPNHALFVCYAPFDAPKIGVATRIEYGYSSDYAAETTRDVLKYYFELADEDSIITGRADSLDAVGGNTD